MRRGYRDEDEGYEEGFDPGYEDPDDGGYESYPSPRFVPSHAPRPRRRTPRSPGGTGARKRSNAAVPLAIAVLLAGLVLGQYSVLIPGLLGIGLVYVALSFLSSRLNPFSLSFYLTVKPSWLAIGTLAFAGLVLVGVAYGYYASGFGPFAPGIPRIP